ncbi:TetR family transcriptional regulator [Pseudoxanthobacter sp. M-2]|uniref:TetR/AcrR family transcriptional regulator n=1 Tax=Pseudoxanthobacter sp. M-2 TaxID=3078754 RepID=UPI0038FC9896
MSSERVVAPPPQARGRARFEALLAAAADLIAEHGVDGVAFSQIARRTRTAQGSLYQFFPAKDALVATLHARLADDLVAVVARCHATVRDAPAPRTPKTMIDVLVPALAAFYAANPAYREIRLALPRSAAVLDTEDRADATIAAHLREMLHATGAPIAKGRMASVVSALIEVGDALLPWAGADETRLSEVKILLLAYLTASPDEAVTPPGPSG